MAKRDATARQMTAHEVVRMIRARFEFPEWVVEEEVTLASRRLDVLAFNQWAARGRVLVGFEVKVDRADWLREVRDFAKAEPAVQQCDSFYVVAPQGVLQLEELPAGWGYLEVQGDRLVTRAYPAKREPSLVMPRELAARFLTRFARRANDEERAAEHRERAGLRAEIRKEVEERHARERQDERAELQRLRGELDQLLKALGTREGEWRHLEHAMQAAGVLARHDFQAGGLRRSLEHLARDLDEHATSVREALATLTSTPAMVAPMEAAD